MNGHREMMLNKDINSSFQPRFTFRWAVSGGPEVPFIIQAVVESILGVWIIAVNLTLILAILRDNKLRRSIFCAHMVNLSVSHLLVGVFLLPLLVSYTLNGKWIHGWYACYTWLIGDIFLGVVSIYIILTIVWDRLLYLSCFVRCGGKHKNILCALMLLIPWILSLALVVAIYVPGKLQRDILLCYFVLPRDFEISLSAAGFFIPGGLAVFFCITVFILVFAQRKRMAGRPTQEKLEHPRHQTIAAITVTGIFLVMWTPYQTLTLLVADGAHIRLPVLPTAVVMWFAYANAAVTPFLWLIMPQIRLAFKHFFCSTTSGIIYIPDQSELAMQAVETRIIITESKNSREVVPEFDNPEIPMIDASETDQDNN